MKNILTISLLCLCTLVRSADLIVEENGASGAYTTIAAAVAASAAGDRILVFPRSANAAYAGFTYAGGGLQILSAVEGQKYRVNSAVNIGAITGDVLISNMEGVSGLGSIQTTAAPAANRTTRIVACRFDGVTNTVWNYSNHFVYFQNDSFVNQASLFFTHGGVTGCYFENSYAEASSNVAPAQDTILFIGNKIANAAGNPSRYPLFMGQSISYIRVENNFIVSNFTGQFMMYLYGYSNNGAPTGGNIILNNTFVRNYAGSQYLLNYSSNSCVTLKNNAFINAVGGGTLPIYGNGSYVGTASYNIATGTNTPAQQSCFYVTADNTNTWNASAATLTYNATTGAITSALGIDDGDPNQLYLDTDLTRNDVGCYGGSYTRANFGEAVTSSQVLFVRTPRRTLSTQTFGIQGDGFDK